MLANEAGRVLGSRLGPELAGAFGFDSDGVPVTSGELACRVIQLIEAASEGPAAWFPWAEVLTYAWRKGRYESLAHAPAQRAAGLLKSLGSELESLDKRARSDDDQAAYGLLAHAALQRASGELETLAIGEQRAAHDWALSIANELHIPVDILGWPPLHP
jgi:hypothetical protein